VTGHSRGGALATLLVVLPDLNGLRVHRLVTFGSPMVDDGRFASLFSGGDVKPPGRLRGLRVQLSDDYSSAVGAARTVNGVKPIPATAGKTSSSYQAGVTTGAHVHSAGPLRVTARHSAKPVSL
jgi:pimeloyl-ACP methyl ester carboxylesterase